MEIQQQTIIVINEEKSLSNIIIDAIFYTPHVTICLIGLIFAYIVYNWLTQKQEKELQVPRIAHFNEESVESSFLKSKNMVKKADPIKVMERWQEISREEQAKNVKKVSKIDLFTKCHQLFKKINKQTQLYKLKMEEEEKEEKRKELETQKQREIEKQKNATKFKRSRYRFGSEDDQQEDAASNGQTEQQKSEGDGNRSSNRKLTIEKFINNNNDPARSDSPKKSPISTYIALGDKTTGEPTNPLIKPATNNFNNEGGFFNQTSTNLVNKAQTQKLFSAQNQQNQANKAAIDKNMHQNTLNEGEKKQASVNFSNIPSLFSNVTGTKKEEPKTSTPGFISQVPQSSGHKYSFNDFNDKPETSNSSRLASFAALPTSKPATQAPKMSPLGLPTFTSPAQSSTVPPTNNNGVRPIATNSSSPISSAPASAPISNPVAPPSTAANRPSAPPPPANQKLQLTSEQFLETIIKFADSMTITTEITTTMSNLGGARSNINDLLVFSKSFINSINKEDDKQITTFALKVYNSIVHTLIAESNVKDGLERMPPKSKTSQVEKSSITCYVIIINFYRMMGYEKVWTIIFGKTLKLLQFIYTRKEDVKSYKELDLIKNKYIELKGDIAGRYLSRIDFLTYFLFGLTSFDPFLIFSQLEHKDASLRKSREEIESWNYKWSYKEFWMLTDVFFRNKHESYFKPIVYINLLSVLFSRVYQHKRNPTVFKDENNLYKIILDLGKQFFTKYSSNKEIAVLSNDDEGTHERYHFSYDGEDFTDAGIKVLDIRLGVEKLGEFRLGPKDFDTKANVFYYFCKQKQ